MNEACGVTDILIQVSSDDDPHMEAILRGLKKRHLATGDLPILIHTVGYVNFM